MTENKTLEIDNETYAKIEARAKEKGISLTEYISQLALALKLEKFNKTKVTVDFDQKTYNFIKLKLPWVAETIEDFTVHALSLMFERYMLLISQTPKEQ